MFVVRSNGVGALRGFFGKMIGCVASFSFENGVFDVARSRRERGL